MCAPLCYVLPIDFPQTIVRFDGWLDKWLIARPELRYQNMNYSPSLNHVEIRNLRFSRGDRVIFKSLDLDIPKGKITTIMGPSGSGKTTLLRLIGGQLAASSGEILIAGVNINSMRKKQLLEMRNNTGVLFQSSALFTGMSVLDNVAFPLRLHTSMPDRMIRDLVTMKLQAVGLRGAMHLMPAQLSGGMARRVALARAIIMDPQMLMYDEPFTGQDPISLGIVKTLIKNLNKTLGLTSLVISHDVVPSTELADKIAIIIDGRVAAEGSPKELLATEDKTVKQFIKGEPDGPVAFHFPTSVNYTQALINPQ